MLRANKPTQVTAEVTDSFDSAQLNQLLEQVATRHNKAAFAQLFRLFAPKIRAYGLQKLKQDSAAMDLVQETMLLVWRKACLFNPDKGKASTWIYTVMRNHCFDMLRKNRSIKEQTCSDDIWPLTEGADQATHVTQQTGLPDHLLSRALLKHIDSLPTHQKQVITAIYIEEMTQQELADLLDVPVGTIKSRLRLATNKLRAKLEQEHDQEHG